MPREAMSAVVLSRLLADRHAADVFVPECKMGSAGSRVLDGWALLPTWSPLTAIGYEIKVSRSDWLKDTKWEEYRAVCHLMIVVAPKGIVSPSELPAGVGLLEPLGQGTGMRLVMRVKPVRQEPDAGKLVKLMAHVLMWRKDQQDWARYGTKASRAAYWRKWVDERQDFQTIGRDVKGRMRTILRDAIDAKNKAERRAEALEAAGIVLRELGIEAWGDTWTMRRRIEQALKTDATQTIGAIARAMDSLTELRSRVERAAETERGSDVA